MTWAVQQGARQGDGIVAAFGERMLCLRHTSAIGSPASPSFRIATIWLSLNLLFLIGSLLSDWAAFSGFGCLLEAGAYGLRPPITGHNTLQMLKRYTPQMHLTSLIKLIECDFTGR